MTRTLAFILSATLAASCAAQDRTQIEYAANVPNPELVEIAPGVQVVADSRDPVFHTSNAFWLHRDGRWYRNDALAGRWIWIATPPSALASISEPGQYANYRPVTRTVEERDLRTMREPEPQRPPAPYPRPPQQEPPAPIDDPGTVPSQPPEPDDLTRPDPIRD